MGEAKRKRDATKTPVVDARTLEAMRVLLDAGEYFKASWQITRGQIKERMEELGPDMPEAAYGILEFAYYMGGAQTNLIMRALIANETPRQGESHFDDILRMPKVMQELHGYFSK